MTNTFNLQTKYIIVFILTLTLIISGLLIGVYGLKQHQLRNEATAIAEQVVAFRAWIANTGVVWVDHLTPEFPDFLGKRIGTMATTNTALEFYSKNPALATRELSELANKSTTRATFRVTSDEYRNPANAPDAFERASIQFFKNDKTLSYNDMIDDNSYRYAQPILVQQSCLKCHGDPSVAPPEVIAKYGSKRAFNYQVGDVRGIISVALPDVTVFEVMGQLLNPYTLLLIILAFIINVLYAQLVIVRRIKLLAKDTESLANGDLELVLNVRLNSHDEIDHLTRAIDLLRNSVVIAMRRLRKKM